MSLLLQVQECVDSIRARCQLRPAVGLVLGSGMAGLASVVGERVTRIPFSELPHWPQGAVEGHGHELVLGSASTAPVAVLTGRAHAYEGFTGAQLSFPIRVLARLGVRDVVLTSAVGGLSNTTKPADLLIIEDHINLMGTNPLAGPHEEGLGDRFPDLTHLYDPGLRQVAEQLCWKVGVTARRGVYAAFLGPSYETAAEVQMARTLGAHVVGMSVVPEAIVARQCGVRVLGLSCITNLAAGLSRQPLAHSEVLAVAQRSRAALADLLGALLPAIHAARA